MNEQLEKALKKAVSKHDIKTLLKIVNDNPDVNLNFVDVTGKNLLHVVAVNIHPDSILTTEFLLAQNVNPNIPDETLKTPLDYAEDKYNFGVINVLKNTQNKTEYLNDDYK